MTDPTFDKSELNTDNRYWLFQGTRYYPNGGMEDFAGSFDSVEAAQSAASIEDEQSWAHIWDVEMGRIVVQYNDSKYVRQLQGWRTPEEMDTYFHNKTGDGS